MFSAGISSLNVSKIELSTKMNQILVFAYLILEAIAFILSVFGNLMVCYVMLYKSKLVGFSSRFILSMSIADMLIGLIAIPTAIVKVSG